MKKCIIENCNNTNIIAKGLCCKHYKQQYRHGFILKRTIYDKNEFVFDNEVCIIKCFDKNGGVSYEARITINGKEKYLGRYKTIEEAEQVRKQAEKELFEEGHNL